MRALKALRSVEKSMSDAWRGSMRSQELWTLETGVTDSLLKAFDRGRHLRHQQQQHHHHLRRHHQDPTSNTTGGILVLNEHEMQARSSAVAAVIME